jgi:rod shape-determining protein MreD
MYKKVLLYFIIVFLLSALQISLINGLPANFNNLNVILVILVYAVAMSKKIFSWCLAFGAGLFFDLFLFSPFGLYTLGITLTIFLVYLLHINFFTNQSLYTFLTLVIFATIIFRTWSYLFFGLNAFFINIDNYIVLNEIFWYQQLFALILNVSLTIIIFYFLSYISRRLTPVFLMSKKNEKH